MYFVDELPLVYYFGLERFEILEEGEEPARGKDKKKEFKVDSLKLGDDMINWIGDLGKGFLAFAADNGVCQVWDKAMGRVVDELGCGKGSLVSGVVGAGFLVCGTHDGGVFVWS